MAVTERVVGFSDGREFVCDAECAVDEMRNCPKPETCHARPKVDDLTDIVPWSAYKAVLDENYQLRCKLNAIAGSNELGAPGVANTENREMPDSPRAARSLVETVAQFKSDVQAMQLVVDTLASIGDSCEAPVAIQAREALVRIGNFVPAVLDAVAEPSDAMTEAACDVTIGPDPCNKFGATYANKSEATEIWRTMLATLREEIE